MSFISNAGSLGCSLASQMGMKRRFLAFAALVTAITAHAQTPSTGKIGVLHVQNAVLNTVEDHQALTAFESKVCRQEG